MRLTPPAALLLLPALLLTACGGEEEPAAAGEHAEHGATADAAGERDDQGAHDQGAHDHGAHDHGAHDHGDLVIAESGVGQVLDARGDGFGSLLREAPLDARPTVALVAQADPAGGWTVEVATTGFRWTPLEVNTPADAGAGHAHLYADGQKVARVYGEWSFVPASAAEPGQTLTVVLYADDHTAWGVDGVPVRADVVLPAVPA